MKFKEIFRYFDSPASLVSYFFVDRLAAPIVWMNVNFLKIHPNVISLFSGLFASLTAWEFFRGRLAMGAVFYLLSFLFDSVDGPSARAMDKKTRLGVVLEVWFDSTRLVGSSFALAWNLYESTGSSSWILMFLLWGVSFGAGIWTYEKAKESFKEEIFKKSEGEYSFTPFVTWMDLEMLEFFFAPLFGFAKVGYVLLSFGYFLTTLGMSLYMVFMDDINRIFKGKGKKER